MGTLASPIYQWAGKFVAPDWEQAKSVADVGCGNAIFIRHLVSRTKCAPKTIHLLDQSANQLRAGSRNIANISASHPDTHTHVATAEHIPLASASCDLVISTGSINLWQPPEKGLAECVRILKPGGTLWVFDQRPCTDVADVTAALFRQRIFGLGLPGYTQNEIMYFAKGLPLSLIQCVEDRSLYGLQWRKDG